MSKETGLDSLLVVVERLKFATQTARAQVAQRLSWPRARLLGLSSVVVAVLVLVFGATTIGADSDAIIMVSNIDKSRAVWTAIRNSAGEGGGASSFTTGSSAVRVSKARLDIGTRAPLTTLVGIFADDSGSPGTELHRLTNPCSTDDHRDFISSGYDLSASTTYWLVARPPPPPSRSPMWALTATTSLSVAQTGWSMNGDQEYWFDDWHARTGSTFGGKVERYMWALYASAVPSSTATSTGNNTATGVPTISGDAEAGRLLRVCTTAIYDVDGVSGTAFAYQWLADDTEINGATSTTYRVGSSDVGKSIKVKVSFTDDQDNSETLFSQATAAVIQPFAISGSTATTYPENATTTVATYAAIGARAGGTITWSLFSAFDGDDFSINSAGVLTFKSPPDYENPTDTNEDNGYYVRVNASDGTETAYLDVRVTVTDVNETPVMMLNQ